MVNLIKEKIMLFEYQILTFNINSLEEFNEEYPFMFDEIFDLMWDTTYAPLLDDAYENALVYKEYYPDYRIDTAMAIHTDTYRQEAHDQVRWILTRWKECLTAGRLPESQYQRYRRRKNALAGRY